MILKRILQAAPALVGVVIVSFVLTRLLPGDPAAYFAGPAATEESIAEIRSAMGLDKSLPLQFLDYVWNLVRGDLGNSLSTGQPVVEELARRLPASLELTLSALILSCAIALPLGIAAARAEEEIEGGPRILDHRERLRRRRPAHRVRIGAVVVVPAAPGLIQPLDAELKGR